MNAVFFKCEQCKEYIDAGGRWAILKLVNPRIVSDEGEERPIDIGKVLACAEYIDKLPVTREFLEAHRGHTVIFTALYDIFETGEWLDLTAHGRVEPYEVKPRTLVEKLGFTRWEEVEAWIERADPPPLWTEDPGLLGVARERFEQLVKGRGPSQ
jgi:hypothetical protein